MTGGYGAWADPRSLAQGEDYPFDRGRRRILWLALAVSGILGLALVLIVAYGQETISAGYEEPLLLLGLIAFLTCAVAYFTDRERQYRATNRSLLRQLDESVQALNARSGRLTRLCETSTEVAQALNVERISELVVDALVNQVQADAASLILVDKSRGQRVHARTTGPLAEGGAQRDCLAAIAKQLSEEPGPSMHLFEKYPALAEQLEAWGKVRAAIAAPVKVSDVIGGVLAAIGQGSFDTEDLNMLTTLANMAGRAIESADLHERLRQQYFRALHILARVLAARDPYSATHGRGVTRLACRLAARLSLRNDAIEALRAYCPLHDLGKMGVPDSVLTKAGPLTYEESEMCRQHPAIGEEIIRPLDPGPLALSIFRSHHERWDGLGYPDGLKGEQIPILGRVVGVADAVHAMASYRYYRGAESLSSVLSKTKALAGTQFDPEVVQALADLWEVGELDKLITQPNQREEDLDIVDLPPSTSAPNSSVQ